MSMGQRKISRFPTMNRPKDSIPHFSALSLSYRDLSTHSELGYDWNHFKKACWVLLE